MPRDLLTSRAARLEAMDEVCMLLRQALDRLDRIDAGILAAAEIDQALHNLRRERERLR